MTFTSALADALTIAAFRALPIALGAVAVSRRWIGLLATGAVLAVLTGYGGVARTAELLAQLALLGAYLSVAGYLACAFRVERAALPFAVAAPIVALVVVAGPVLTLGGRPSLAITLLAWERSFAVLSLYLSCDARATPMPSVLFFLLADASIEWRRRATAAPMASSLGGAGRALLGVGLLAAPVLHELWPRLGVAQAVSRAPRVAELIATGVTLLVVYATHSGLAHLQIGLLRALGHLRVSERYDYPFAARSPMDFWRRWNRWLGRWCEEYVFTPVYRRARGTSAVRYATATLAVFLFVGVSHDGYVSANELRLPTRLVDWSATLFFLLVALTMVAWRACGALARRRGIPRRVQAWMARLGMVFCFVVLGALARALVIERRLPNLAAWVGS